MQFDEKSAAAYIAAMTDDLVKMAAKHEFRVLERILAMALVEATQVAGGLDRAQDDPPT